MLFLCIAIGVLLSQPPSSAATGTGAFVELFIALPCYLYVADTACMRAYISADDCTSGFMSLDRMYAVLGNYGRVMDYSGVEQAIIPGINFTCSGSIESWTFGADWEKDTDFIELQIWRPGSEDGSYTKVGNTTINVEEEGQTDLYHYPLTSPLHFQAGDILGYYFHMRLKFEKVGSGYPLYYTYPGPESPASQFSTDNPQAEYTEKYHVLVSVTTGKLCMQCYWQ